METRTYNRYSYQELADKALKHGAEQIDIDTLGAWFEHYGTVYWNGEFFEIDSAHRLYPVAEMVDPETEDWRVVRYEIR